MGQSRSQPDIWSCECKFFCVYRPYKESISKEMNNDNVQLLSWLRYCLGHTVIYLGSSMLDVQLLPLSSRTLPSLLQVL